MSLFKKLSLTLLFLPLILVISSFKSNAQTPVPCVTGKPTINITFPTSKNRNGAPGQEKPYTVSVFNHDTGNCPVATFVLSKEDHDNWGGVFDLNPISLPKNSSKDTQFKLTSPLTVTAGVKTFTLGVKRQSAANTQSTIQGTYTVEIPTTPTPTPTPTIKPTASPTPVACNNDAPTIEFVPPTNRNGAPGDTKTFEVKITNRDKGVCDPETFVLSKENHPNWVSTFDENPLTINKNSSKNTKFNITSPADEPAGPRQITIGVKKQSHTAVQATAIVTYTVVLVTPTPTTKPSSGPSGTPGPCTVKDPTLSVVPLSRTDRPGATVTYEITLHNNNVGAGCASRTGLVLTRDLPGGTATLWTGNFSKRDGFDIPAGGTATSTLSVTSPKTAVVGPKDITVNLKNSTGVIKDHKALTYVISNAPPGCTIHEPTVSVVPMTNTQRAGGTVTYNVTVHNMDLGSCANRSLTLIKDLPGGTTTLWAGNFSKRQFDIAPASTDTAVLTVTSPASAVPGSKKVVVSLKNAKGVVKDHKDLEYVVSNTGPSISPTPTPICIDCVTPTPGGTAGSLTLRVGTDGIGTTPRVKLGGNVNPQNPNRNLTVSLYKAGENTLGEKWVDWSFTFNQANENFEATLPLSDTFQSGVYNLYVQGSRFLTAQFPNSLTVNRGQINSPSPMYLITGNVNNVDQSANKLDIMDYNVLISCSIYSQSTATCDTDPNYKANSDLNDDGIINEDDLTLYVLEVANQEGVIIPVGGPTPTPTNAITPSPTPIAGSAHILGAYSINQTTDVELATSLGLNSSVLQIPAQNSAVTQKMKELGMKQYDSKIINLIYRFECARLPAATRDKWDACDAAKKNPIKTKAELLNEVDKYFISVKDNDAIGGYFVIGDWSANAGSVKDILKEINTLAKKYTPGKPTICTFSSGHLAVGGGDGWSHNKDWVLQNYSPEGCNYVGIYVYAQYHDKNQSPAIDSYDWTMAKLLPKIKADLRNHGWNNNVSPIIGIPQAMGRESSDKKKVIITSTQAIIRKQTKSFCEQGAQGIIYFTWRSSSPGQYPYSDTKMAEGMNRGISDCKAIWG